MVHCFYIWKIAYAPNDLSKYTIMAQDCTCGEERIGRFFSFWLTHTVGKCNNHYHFQFFKKIDIFSEVGPTKLAHSEEEKTTIFNKTNSLDILGYIFPNFTQIFFTDRHQLRRKIKYKTNYYVIKSFRPTASWPLSYNRPGLLLGRFISVSLNSWVTHTGKFVLYVTFMISSSHSVLLYSINWLLFTFCK